MGEPDSITTEDIMRQLALGALGPKGTVPTRILRETGLHREFLQSHFQSLQPEIKYLVGWKELREFGYRPPWRDYEIKDQRRGQELTKTWLEILNEHGIADELAVLIFDGELRQMPAPDYRLFVLRDGRMLYYAGGFHARALHKFACGDVLGVLDTLDKSYSNSPHDLARQPFLIILQALADAFERAIKDREAKVRTQRALLERLNYAIKQVSAK